MLVLYNVYGHSHSKEGYVFVTESVRPAQIHIEIYVV